jgi:hypothetical protein
VRELAVLFLHVLATVARPLSHPFVERLIGTIRRECLDRTLFWTATDLERKRRAFQSYYNGYRAHTAGGAPPANPGCRAASTRVSIPIAGSRSVAGCIRRRWRHERGRHAAATRKV